MLFKKTLAIWSFIFWALEKNWLDFEEDKNKLSISYIPGDYNNNPLMAPTSVSGYHFKKNSYFHIIINFIRSKYFKIFTE